VRSQEGTGFETGVMTIHYVSALLSCCAPIRNRHSMYWQTGRHTGIHITHGHSPHQPW